MIRLTETEVFGFWAALRDMRNPMESWSKSDSRFGDSNVDQGFRVKIPEFPEIGKNDLELACKLIKGGTEHRKFLRQIIINFVIEAPRYVWQEIDTYKVATVRNSCSTMHKLGHRPLTVEDFIDGEVLPDTLRELNRLGAGVQGGRQEGLRCRAQDEAVPAGGLLAAGRLPHELRDRHVHVQAAQGPPAGRVEVDGRSEDRGRAAVHLRLDLLTALHGGLPGCGR